MLTVRILYLRRSRPVITCGASDPSIDSRRVLIAKITALYSRDVVVNQELLERWRGAIASEGAQAYEGVWGETHALGSRSKAAARGLIRRTGFVLNCNMLTSSGSDVICAACSSQ